MAKLIQKSIKKLIPGTERSSIIKESISKNGFIAVCKNENEMIELAKGKGDMKTNLKKARILPSGYTSNFRSGKINQWREEFTKMQIEKCKKLLGPALIELGYEKDLEWK